MSQRWSQPTRRTLICACWSVGITLATASYLGLIYPTLPDGLPVRYLHGEPVFFQIKTPVVVMLPAFVQMALVAICLARIPPTHYLIRPDCTTVHLHVGYLYSAPLCSNLPPLLINPRTMLQSLLLYLADGHL